jgi:tripartite-type tricarboxylate transporter receptor subunit TctC
MKVWKAIVAATLAVLASTTHTLAQGEYPNRTITLIVPGSAGGNADVSSRLVARLLSEKLGQTGWSTTSRVPPASSAWK